MNKLTILIIRMILGCAFSVILARIFFPSANLIYVLGLAIFLIGMAYVSEYFHKRKQ